MKRGASFLAMTLLFGEGFLSANFAPAAESEAIEKSIKDFNSPDFVKHSEAKRRLRSYRFREIAEAMANYADDPNPDMRILIAQTLGELGGFEAAEELKRLFFKE